MQSVGMYVIKNAIMQLIDSVKFFFILFWFLDKKITRIIDISIIADTRDVEMDSRKIMDWRNIFSD